MNAHMIVTEFAMRMMVCGTVLAVLFIVAGVALLCARERKLSAACAAFAAIGIAMLLYGAYMPRVKELRVCVSGPVSLETISTKYEIINIDGKELTLRER